MNTAKKITPDVTLEQLADMLKALDGEAVVTPAIAGKVEDLGENVLKEDIATMDSLAALEKNNLPATPQPDVKTIAPGVVGEVIQMPLDVGETVLAELERKNVAGRSGRAGKPAAADKTVPPQQKVDAPTPTQPRGRFDLMGMNDEEWLKIGLATDAATSLNIIRECPVKVQEKALNIVQWMLHGHLLSVFTELSLAELIRNETATSASLRAMFMSNPDKMYTVGTAGSQAGQMMKLLPAMGIATCTGKTLKVNPDSPVVKQFKSMNA